MKVYYAGKHRESWEERRSSKCQRGYARNYLIPRVYALYATPENLKKLGTIQQELKAAEQKQYEELKKLAEKNSLCKADL
jgi:ribosomal protein L9